MLDTIDWSKRNILSTENGGLVVMSNIWDGDGKHLFCGTVIQTNDERKYPVGEYSKTWHKSLFKLINEPVTITFI